MSVRQLFSIDRPITQEEHDAAKAHAKKVGAYPIWYADVPGDVDEIAETIDHFFKHHVEPQDIGVVLLDHTLLIKGRQGEQEREKISALEAMLIYKKKQHTNSLYVQLSQLNRGIEYEDRILNPERHYPKRGDIFGSDAVYQASDYVMISHRPELLLIKGYGASNLPTKDRVYWHVLKARDGEPVILSMLNKLAHNKIGEVTNV